MKVNYKIKKREVQIYGNFRQQTERKNQGGLL